MKCFQKNCEDVEVEDADEEKEVLSEHTDHTTIPDDIVEDHVEMLNKADIIAQNEELFSQVEETSSNSIINDNAIQINGELKSEDSTSEVPKLFKDNDNNLDQKLSDELLLRPINGYILQTNNSNINTDLTSTRIEISLKTSNDEVIDNNFLENVGNQLKPLRDDHIIIKIGENPIVESQEIKEAEFPITTLQNDIITPESQQNSFEMKPLYPITQAVKEWMTKTRETTPEIEILKSPDTIYRELIEDSSDDNTETETGQKNGIGNPSRVGYLNQHEINARQRVAKHLGGAKFENIEDDVTICETWSMSQDASLQEDDLLDCWEPDIVEMSRKDEPIEQGEDVLTLIENAQSDDLTTNGQAATEPRKIKKKRRRKISKTINQDETTSSEDGYSSDEAVTQVENRVQAPKKTISCNGIEESTPTVETVTSISHKLNEECPAQNAESQTESIQEETILVKETDISQDKSSIIEKAQPENRIEEEKLEEIKLEEEDDQKIIPEETTPTDERNDIVKNESKLELDQNEENGDNQTPTQESINSNPEQTQTNPSVRAETLVKESKFNLNAEEFVPRAYRPMEPIPVDPNLQFINIHSNFVPLPLMNHPLNELNPPPHFNPPFLPPGIPLNFMPGDPKLLPNFVNFVPNHFVQHPKNFEQTQTTKVEECKDKTEAPEEKSTGDQTRIESIDEKKPEEKPVEVIETEKVENNDKTINSVYKNDVDIAKIVSKLEEAAKEQKFYENRRQNYRSPSKFNKTPRQRYNSPYQNEYKQDHYKTYYDKRKPKRFETPTTSSSDANQSETASSNKTTPISEDKTLNQTKSEEIQTDLQTKTEPKDITRPRIQDERRYSPRHQNKMSNSPKRYINNYNRNPKITNTTSENHISFSVPNTEYSDTLKRSTNYSKSCPRFEKYSNRNNIIPQQNKNNPIKKLDEPVKETVRTSLPTKTSQWISVSSKKKRKNRSTPDEDNENLIEDSDCLQAIEDTNTVAEEFETIEIKEVITLIEPKLEEVQSSKIENIIEVISNCEASPNKTNDIPNIDQIQLRDVKDIEEELLKASAKQAEIEVPLLKQEEIPKVVPEPKPESCQTQPTPKSTNQHENQKKKVKKSGGKNATKRIIIFDPHVSKEETHNINAKTQLKPEPQIKENPEKISQKNLKTETAECVQIIKEVDNVPSTKEVASESVVPTLLEESIDISTTPDKKKSKKKKKLPKSNLSTSIPSISSSTATLNNMDDSYDFLLDTTSLIDDKTNIEVSEELDKMIQKGLFGNLEEKFRSLNVSVDDDFFKSLSLKPKTQSTPEKGFIKATNFTTILNNNNSSLPKVSLDQTSKIDIDFSKIKLPDYEPQPSTSKSGNFLEKATENDTGPPPEISQHVSNSKSNGKLKNKKNNGAPKFKEASLNVEEVASQPEEIVPTDEIALGSEEFTSENEILSKNCEDVKVEDADEEKEVLSEHTDRTTIPDDIVEDEVEIPNKDDIIAQNEELFSQVEETSSNSIIDENAIQVNGELKSEDSTSEVPKLFKDNDNNLDQKLSDELLLRPINGYILQTNNSNINTDLTKAEFPITTLQNDIITPESQQNSFEMKPLYPITQAVKEWMTKTRETTPEIEILKSPDTIYRELIEDSSDDDTEIETGQKNGIGNPSRVGYLNQHEINARERVAKRLGGAKFENIEDDVTICETWSMSQDTSLQEDDLLDCWEPDVVEISRKEEPIEQGEDVLTLIENAQNDDSQRLKTELTEDHRRSAPFPKHGTLPYRAICCSLM
ncbi:hypothetical protein MML48_9g00002441 [Holotrichia oblita]|uniref:Uncharacterized protein n=1 Tax=Holotrichia oblita TaxID=644536 RepID=A0ACB9SN73_HOLOL|nr:hypothetical protein MML48_9g00002441 [Holotrichia oblita]